FLHAGDRPRPGVYRGTLEGIQLVGRHRAGSRGDQGSVSREGETGPCRGREGFVRAIFALPGQGGKGPLAGRIVKSRTWKGSMAEGGGGNLAKAGRWNYPRCFLQAGICGSTGSC